MTLDGAAVLILGAAGSGKSTLALELMAYGATLVADDRVLLTVEQGQLTARCPPAIQGMIEARGVGILNAAHVSHSQVVLAVDLDQQEVARLPPRRLVTFLGVALPLLHRVNQAHFAPAILQYLRAGRHS